MEEKTTNREELFDTLLERVNRIVEDNICIGDKLQLICSVLQENVPHYDWVGFYLVDRRKEDELVLGPFVGEPTEHKRIPFGRGVCGRAADERRTVVVDDVSEEENYLACSLKVKSEIVVPLLKGDELLGELDIDSHTPAAFDDADRSFLEKVCERVSRLF